MVRIEDFFGAHRAPVQHPRPEWMRENQEVVFEENQTINQAQPGMQNRGKVNQGQRVELPRVEQAIPREIPAQRVVMVNCNKDVDEILQRFR